MKISGLGIRKPFAGRTIDRRGKTALMILAALGWWAGSASATPVVRNVGTCVKGAYTTISAAVAAASAGDTISVCPGTYNETVTITKNVSLVGKPPASGVYPTLEYPATNQCGSAPVQLPDDCAQILVQNATAQIENLHIDGSAFAMDSPAAPVGIFFFNASGSAFNNSILDQMSCVVEPDLGIGILAQTQLAGPYTVQATGNYIDNFGDAGIFTNASQSPSLTFNATNNSIGLETENNWGIRVFNSVGSSALNNTLWGTGIADNQIGIYFSAVSKSSLTRNTISNVSIGIETDSAQTSTLNANGITDAQNGIKLLCASNNALVSNKVSGDPSLTTAVGVNIYDCAPFSGGSTNNLLNGNKFDTLCAGILTGSALNTGNKLISNTFTNVDTDVGTGNVCTGPC